MDSVSDFFPVDHAITPPLRPLSAETPEAGDNTVG
jgi:hypothetical protein